MRFQPAIREVMVVLKVLWQAYFLNNSDAIIKNILKPNLLVAQGTYLHFEMPSKNAIPLQNPQLFG